MGIMAIGIIGTTATIAMTVVAGVTVAEIAVEAAVAVEIAEVAVAAVLIAGRVAEIGGQEGQVETGGPEEQAEAADRRDRKNKRFEITRK
jgi:hypothetical protein